MVQRPPEYRGDRSAVRGTGSRVAGYLLEAQIGAGGMAVVYRARDERLGRLVALKIMAPAMAGDETFRRRFVLESRAAAAVDDPHIIPVYQAGEADGVLFIAMRFVAGGDVRSLLRREGPLSPARVMSVISSTASALDAAHAAGLVHRDVKPANMLLDSQAGRPDHVYLSDFGLSKGVQSGQLTASGEFLGTPDYIAPEQIQGAAADGRTDQYALACSAFELLTGEAPFASGEGWATVWAHLNTPPPTLTSRRPELPPAADEVFARALAKAPHDRYASCREFAGALRDALGLGPYGVPARGVPARGAAAPGSATRLSRAATTVTGTWPRSPAGGTEAGGRPARSRRRRRGMIAVAGAILVGASVLGVLIIPALAGAAGHSHALAGVPAPAPRHSPPAVAPLFGRIAAFTPPRTAGQWQEVTSVAFSPDGKSLATGLTTGHGVGRGSSGDTYLWNVASGRQYAVLAGAGSAEAFSPDGRTLAVGGGAGQGLVLLANPRAGAAMGGSAMGLPGTRPLPVRNIAFSPDGRLIAADDTGGGFHLWSALSGQLIRTMGASKPPFTTALAISPDGKTLATGETDGTHSAVYLWNLATGRRVAVLPEPGVAVISSVAFSPNGAMLAVTQLGARVLLWDTVTLRPVAVLDGPGSLGAETLAFSPDSRMLAAGDASGRTYLWNVRSRTLAAVLANPVPPVPPVSPVLRGPTRNTVYSVAFSPDGRTLATSDTDGSAYLWRVR